MPAGRSCPAKHGLLPGQRRRSRRAYGVRVRLARQLLSAVRIVAADRRIPRPLRWLAGAGLLPIPGPVDELLLLAVAIPLALFYRRPLADAWRRAGAEGSGRRA